MNKIYRFLNISIVIFSLCLTACADRQSALEEASLKYRQSRDYASLEFIHNQLVKGMPRQAVLNLLGEPDYSPIEGQYYYSSNKSIKIPERASEVPVGLVVDYRNPDGILTDSLQTFSLGPIGE